MIFVIVQDYTDSTDLFNSVELHGPFKSEDEAMQWIDTFEKDCYRRFTITTTTLATISSDASEWQSDPE
jgi:hypothetical protein